MTRRFADQNSQTVTPPNWRRQPSIWRGVEDRARSTSSAKSLPRARESLTMAVTSACGRGSRREMYAKIRRSSQAQHSSQPKTGPSQNPYKILVTCIMGRSKSTCAQWMVRRKAICCGRRCMCRVSLTRETERCHAVALKECGIKSPKLGVKTASRMVAKMPSRSGIATCHQSRRQLERGIACVWWKVNKRFFFKGGNLL